jgi:hypothetical protein
MGRDVTSAALEAEVERDRGVTLALVSEKLYRAHQLRVAHERILLECSGRGRSRLIAGSM